MSFKGLGSKKKRASLMSPSVTRKKSKIETKTITALCISESCVPTGRHIFPFDNVSLHRSSANRDLGKYARFKKFEACSLPHLEFDGSSGLIRMTSGDSDILSSVTRTH